MYGILLLSGDAPTVGINDTIVNGLTTAQLQAMRDEIIDSAQTGDLPSQLGIPYSKVRDQVSI